jgi:hypothetical protein
MTWHGRGYASEPGASLEDLDMGGGSVLSMRVTGEQSNGPVTVIEGVVEHGGPPPARARPRGRGRDRP